VNLASDIPGMAPLTDPDLKNPWGISHSPTSPLWVSNQGTNSSTLYTLAIASTSHGDRLFAANFAQGRIDVFNSKFHMVKTALWQFRDPRLPRGYLPFNTQTLNGNIFVAYDKADPVTGRQAVGRHLGVLDEFSPDGRLISRITSGGALNAPWALAIAPASWGHAAGSLLVGNFGDGRINILAKQGHHFAHRSPAWSGSSPRASRSLSQACGACCPAPRPTAAPTRSGSPRASTTSRTACSASCGPNTRHAQPYDPYR
jgi:hypothetical protein